MPLLSAAPRAPASMPPPPPAAALRLHLPGDPARPEVEDFVRAVYARHFGAAVTRFAPLLVSLRDADGALAAAAGYRSAAGGPLYLERYLPRPVDELLAPHAGGVPARGGIVEIGHLASGRAGAGRRLMLLLGPHLARQRFRWAACTLTREMRQVMLRLGVTPLRLGPADPGALGDEAAQWGSYYAHAPEVLAGEILPQLRRLARAARQERA